MAIIVGSRQSIARKSGIFALCRVPRQGRLVRSRLEYQRYQSAVTDVEWMVARCPSKIHRSTSGIHSHGAVSQLLISILIAEIGHHTSIEIQG